MAYTTIDDPSAHFQAYAFTKSSGSGSATFDGNSNLQPDFLWVKSRTNADSHELWDSTRGVNSTVFSNNNEAEDTSSGRISSFDTDGFTWGTAGNLNAVGDFSSFAWKANGGTTVTNTDGSENSTVQANTDAGFSIVEIAGTGANATYGHGLGVKPQVYLVKRTNAAGSWVWATSAYDGTHDYFYLNTASAIQGLGYDQPTTSVFQYNDTSGNTNIVYCFAEKQGYSKFGKYTGNGNADGTFVYTGFKPAFMMIKEATQARNWYILNASDNQANAVDKYVLADLSNAGGTSTNDTVDFLSNGFKLRGTGATTNTNGETYAFMAFAENPFVTSTGIPTTAR